MFQYSHIEGPALISPPPPPPADNTGINAIQLAMDRIMLDTGHCVKFRPKQDFDFDYLYIFPGDG